LFLKADWIDGIKRRLPELPAEKRARYTGELGLPEDAAQLLADDPAYADFFESALFTGYPQPKQVAAWIVGELTRLLKAHAVELGQCLVTPSKLTDLLRLVDSGQISGKIAKDVLDEIFATGRIPDEIVRARGLTQISDDADLRAACDAAIAANPQSVVDFRAGKERALQFLVGQVMKATRGQANPAKLSDLLRTLLGAVHE
ncbi:MAG TPA: Asp-tRNA(Asn)/Glu-tRNA(Gln) amidotransferase GatCAB subunit B, partial [Chloroflexota bacterium]|nr:Asp-tRNA(Asn)/Glu-tRNA(Gln) amidotransferase GatCAB subunit B [Chloroflexota bacterium]